jgi:alkylhydroperoxidase family enzyme
MDTPRIPALAPDDWDPETRDTLAKGLAGPDGSPLNIFATLANHPKLLKRWMVFANHVLSKSTLSPRDRELLILRTGWLCGSEYEWGQHVLIARGCGIGDDEIARVQAGPDAAGWDPFEATLLRAADELHADRKISDAVWAPLSEHLSERKLIELCLLVGHYEMLAMTLNSLQVQPDPAPIGSSPRALRLVQKLAERRAG